MKGIAAIYRKEMLDIVRDRKTLIFMLLVPTILSPVLMILIGNFAISFVKEQAVKRVTIAATAETQERYLQLAHEHFRESEVGRLLRIARNPVVGYLAGRGVAREIIESIPPDVFNDPNAYRQWTITLSGQMQEAIDSADMITGNLPDIPATATAGAPPPEALAGIGEAVFDFYLVSIRGMGLVDFVDPVELASTTAAAPERLSKYDHGDRIHQAIRNKTISGFLVIEDDVANLGAGTETARIAFYHDTTNPISAEADFRVATVTNKAREAILQQRVRAQGLPPSFTQPLRKAPGTNLATTSQMALAALGGMLPYLILTFAFLGGMYPAVDLGAGEKERNTLETLLLAPVSRTEIALGKFLPIFTTSLIAAGLGVCSLFLSFYNLLPEAVLQRLEITIPPSTALFVGLLVVPPSAAFAGLFLAVSIYARSFKEAQNYLSPLPLLMILPAGAGLIPGLETTWKLACIPMVNVSLISRDFLKGDLNWLHYGLTFGSSLVFAAVCLALCVWLFRREEVVFRS